MQAMVLFSGVTGPGQKLGGPPSPRGGQAPIPAQSKSAQSMKRSPSLEQPSAHVARSFSCTGCPVHWPPPPLLPPVVTLAAALLAALLELAALLALAAPLLPAAAVLALLALLPVVTALLAAL